MSRPDLIASFLIVTAGLIALPVAHGSAEELASNATRELASRYDINPGPLRSINPSLRSPLPLSEPAGGADAAKPSGDREPLYNLRTNSRFTPYLGAGGASARLDRLRPAAPNLSSSADPVQGYQGVAGLAYSFSPNVQFNLGYRYSNFQRQDVPVPEDTEIDRQSRDGRAMLLFRYPLGSSSK